MMYAPACIPCVVYERGTDPDNAQLRRVQDLHGPADNRRPCGGAKERLGVCKFEVDDSRSLTETRGRRGEMPVSSLIMYVVRCVQLYCRVTANPDLCFAPVRSLKIRIPSWTVPVAAKNMLASDRARSTHGSAELARQAAWRAPRSVDVLVSARRGPTSAPSAALSYQHASPLHRPRPRRVILAGVAGSGCHARPPAVP